MSKKRIVLIIIVVAIVGLAVALVLVDPAFFSGQNNAPGADNAPAADSRDYVKNTSDGESQTDTTSPAPAPTPAAQSAMATARIFAERYGSYSSDSNFVNLDELEPLASAQLMAELERLKAAADFSQGFYGVSSKALKVEATILDEAVGAAEIKVNLQREETRQNSQPFVYYQDIILSLIRSGDAWLVNRAEWQ
ncbi:MAG TPA: hypothetical protein VJB39_00845 [Patescibacteria group bacterium]|nr:hypothetical protein [Patescibacteria group bacterium]